MIFQEDFVIKKTTVFLLLAISFLGGQNTVQVKLKNGTTATGEFVGTYMDHVHLLISEKIDYFKCDDIQSITKSHIYSFNYYCNKNTVSADILFPPQLNPMTGEWETIIPDVFNPKKRKDLTKEKEEITRIKKQISKDKKPQENSTKQLSFNTGKVLKTHLEETKNNFEKVIKTKVKPMRST